MIKSTYIEINGHKMGSGYPTYIVAELSANHRQQFDEAVELIRKAKEAGADAVKLQTYTPDTLTIQCDSPEFQIGGGTPWDKEPQPGAVAPHRSDLASVAYTNLSNGASPDPKRV